MVSTTTTTTTTNKKLPQTKEASFDERLTAIHTGHGPRVPFRDVRIEG